MPENSSSRKEGTSSKDSSKSINTTSDSSIDYGRLESLGFFRVETNGVLGKGAFGSVELFEYRGDQFKSLCDEKGRVAVKFQSNPDKNELLIAEHLSKNLLKGELSGEKARCNQTAPLEDEAGFLGIVTAYEYYARTVHGEEQEVSRDLLQFLRPKKPPLEHEDPDIERAFQENPAIMLSQIASSMHSSQEALHQVSVLHVDTALRNFMVNATWDEQGNLIAIQSKIVDYGLSKIVEKNENVYDFSHGARWPVKHFNQESLDNGVLSIKTDLHALRLAMIGMVGLASSSDPTHIEEDFIKFKYPDVEESIPDFANKRVNVSDEAYLKILLTKIRDVVDMQCDNNPEKKAELYLFLDCYEDYLLSLPDTHDFSEAQRLDREKLHEANNRFAKRSLDILENRQKESPDPMQYRLALLRLQQLEGLDKTLVDDITERVNSIPLAGPSQAVEPSGFVLHGVNTQSYEPQKPISATDLTNYSPIPRNIHEPQEPVSATDLTNYSPIPRNIHEPQEPVSATDLTNYSPISRNIHESQKSVSTTDETDYRPLPAKNNRPTESPVSTSEEYSGLPVFEDKKSKPSSTATHKGNTAWQGLPSRSETVGSRRLAKPFEGLGQHRRKEQSLRDTEPVDELRRSASSETIKEKKPHTHTSKIEQIIRHPVDTFKEVFQSFKSRVRKNKDHHSETSERKQDYEENHKNQPK
ncbi:protein kinase [Legionella spiritensis]|uniref:protein kinase n=1 Tax=Legionella spiritensis TaxID=452 RepID=UPI001558700B|nr:protein kinase [Legionella spiritensis]